MENTGFDREIPKERNISKKKQIININGISKKLS